METSLPVAPRPAAPPRVAYLGPEHLAAPTRLRARATAKSGRIVAVTFFLDGRPLGSDTTRPFLLDVDPAFLPEGRRRLRVEAVDNLGWRSTTRPVAVTVAHAGSSVVEASPGPSFERARDRLERGDVTVRLAPGRYEVDQLRLGSGARLVGSGRRTLIAPVRADYWALIVARGADIRISDLAIDGGGGAARREGGIAIAVFDGSQDVRLQRLQIRRVVTHGVNVWGAHANISVQDSVIEDDGSAAAGVFTVGSDRSRDTSVIRTRIRGFRSYGILLGQHEFGRPAAALHGLALDNDVSDIRDPTKDACVDSPQTARGCGRNEGGIWSGGVEAAIIGNRIRRARWDGIETVGSSTRTTIVGNAIRKTRTGIYLEHSTNRSVISRNLIADVEAGVNVEWHYDGVGSRRNTFTFNRIVRASAVGLFVNVGGDANRIAENVFVGGARPAIMLQGSSDNLVERNVACGARSGSVVGMQDARWDNGSEARPLGNRLADNKNHAKC